MLQFFQRRFLAWFGVLGLAISVLGALEPLIQIAELVRWLVDHWHETTRFIWSSLFSLWSWKVDAKTLATLNAGAFVFFLWLAADRPPEKRRLLLSIPAGVINFVILVGLFFAIQFATVERVAPDLILSPPPEPVRPEKWLTEQELPNTVAGFFAGTSLANALTTNQLLMLRRLVDVFILTAGIIGLNYLSIYVPVLREWIAYIPKII
jgi:hypothetical protein